MKKLNIKPMLRFPRFEEQWNLIKLGSLLSFKNGINASKEQYGKGIKFINVLDIINNDFITYDKIIGSVDVLENEYAKNEVVYGDILFQRSSETREEVGQSNVYLDKHINATFGGFVIRGHALNPYIPEFLNNLLKTSSARNEITSKSGGSTRYNVGQEILKDVSVVLPSLPEQQKIAAFLTAIDEKIRQLSKKKTLLEQYKKGLMQQIFSQEIRFKPDQASDDNDRSNRYPDWEKKKLGEVCSIQKGIQLNVINMISGGNYPALNGGIEPSGFTNKWNTEKDTITISEGGNSCGYVNYNNERFWCGGHCYALNELEENISKRFLYQSLKYLEPQIMKLRVGSGLPNIQKKALLNYTVSLPNLLEQQKIANFLSAMDDKINLVSLQLERTRQYKKGLLQQMFV